MYFTFLIWNFYIFIYFSFINLPIFVFIYLFLGWLELASAFSICHCYVIFSCVKNYGFSELEINNNNNNNNTLNCIYPSMQFTMEVSQNWLPFLDALINKEDNKIWMNRFFKSTDSKRYIPYKSNHSKPCIKVSLFVLPEEFTLL